MSAVAAPSAAVTYGMDACMAKFSVWIVHLPDSRVEVYLNPTGPVPLYQALATSQPGDHIPLPLDTVAASVPVADVLP